MSDAPARNVTASAPKRSVSDQARVTDAPRNPRARATTAPGSSRIAGREREAQQGHRSSSSGMRPDASQSAASRYMRPRSSRNSRARSRSDTPSSRRARSA